MNDVCDTLREYFIIYPPFSSLFMIFEKNLEGPIVIFRVWRDLDLQIYFWFSIFRGPNLILDDQIPKKDNTMSFQYSLKKWEKKIGNELQNLSLMCHIHLSFWRNRNGLKML